MRPAASIVSALRQLGFHVWRTHDGLTVEGHSNNTGRMEVLLVEVDAKVEEYRFTPADERPYADYPEGVPLLRARSEEDILHFYGWEK